MNSLLEDGRLYSIKDKAQWIKYELKYYRREIKAKKEAIPYMSCNRYANHDIMGMVETNNYIYNRIKEGKPYAIGRIGGNEMNNIAYYMRNEYFPYRTNACRENFHDLHIQAGFFPEDISLQKQYVELMLSDISDIDILGIWNRYMEEWVIEKCNPSIDRLTRLIYLEPMRLEEVDYTAVPWTAALEGKKVLVVHPFAESIISQYTNNREHIFEHMKTKNILPEFDLKVVKAVQSIAENPVPFDNWFDALKHMEDQCDREDYDVAIVGCGAYGLPLAAHIKRRGKIAIHMGGATQLLFGIRGYRWDKGGTGDWFYMNKYWVRPLESEKVNNTSVVEQSCYW